VLWDLQHNVVVITGFRMNLLIPTSQLDDGQRFSKMPVSA